MSTTYYGVVNIGSDTHTDTDSIKNYCNHKLREKYIRSLMPRLSRRREKGGWCRPFNHAVY